LFVPERPYLPPGTLRQAIVRAGHEAGVTDEGMLEALRALDAESLVARAGGFDEERDWDTNFSLREQQLLAISRVLIARPTFVFLDRMTATLLHEDVERVLRALTDRSVTYVLFGAIDGDRALFDAALDIRADGAWAWKSLHGRPLPT